MRVLVLAIFGLGLAKESSGSPTVLVTGATGRTGALLYSWLKEQKVAESGRGPSGAAS